MGRKQARNSSSSDKHEDVANELPLKPKENDFSLISIYIDVVPVKCKRGRPKKVVGSQVMVAVEEDSATLNANAMDELLSRHDEDAIPLVVAFSLKKKR